jgi:DNA (cytosine-5)-methyltransferase 1
MQDILGACVAEEPMTMRQYFDSIDYCFGVDYYFRVPRSYNRRGVFSIDEPCQTIRGVDRPIPSGYTGHPSDPVEIGPKVRALTVLERSYVQTFPKTFKFEGTKSNLNQMIGNAVPVKLAEHIANAIIKYDNARKR